MIDEKSWKEFKETGLLWYINTILHLFGWAIVIEMEDAEIIRAYPARVKFRGFSSDCVDRGYYNVSKYLQNNINDLIKECEQ